MMQRHRLDSVSLVAGVLFALAGLRLLAGPVRLDAVPLDWIGPVALLAVGIGILASLRPRS